MVLQKAEMDGSERSERFSRSDVSLVSVLRTLLELKLPQHSSIKDAPWEINDTNSDSIKLLTSLKDSKHTVFRHEFCELLQGWQESYNWMKICLQIKF